MQSVSAAFTAEARSTSRQIEQGVLVSWKKDYSTSITLFTIGVSAIGGPDIIAGPAGVHSEWNFYRYFDETDRVLGLSYERSLNMPVGGLSVARADVEFDNTSGRYTPHYMGGVSEFSTAVIPRRPIVINTGFEVEGVPQTIPQFVGIGTKQPYVDRRRAVMDFPAADFNEFLANRFIDKTAMFTGQRTDELIQTMLEDLGYTTAQFDLDTGINIVPFTLFEKGTRYQDIFNELIEAEYGHFYQDEEGRLRFENRQHWDSSPHNSISMIINTAEVIDARSPSEDHIVNVVEVRAQPRVKKERQQVFKLAAPLEILSGDEVELFVDFDDPMLEVDTPTFEANSAEDGSGSSLTSSVYLKSSDEFAKAAKYIYHNNASVTAFITTLTIYGRPAKVKEDIYLRAEDDSSVTAFEERPLLIENDYIQDSSWANSLAQMILGDYAEIENLQEIVIRAQPQLQLGDLISWQGRYWRIFGIKAQMDPSIGYTQELKLLQRQIVTYFRIGISTIGGSDKIAP